MKTNIKSTDIAVSKALPIMRMYATGWQQFTCKTSKSNTSTTPLQNWLIPFLATEWTSNPHHCYYWQRWVDTNGNNEDDSLHLHKNDGSRSQIGTTTICQDVHLLQNGSNKGWQGKTEFNGVLLDGKNNTSFSQPWVITWMHLKICGNHKQNRYGGIHTMSRGKIQ